MKKMAIVIVMILACSGCMKEIVTDPNTGETTTKYSIDPEKAGNIESGAEAAQGVAGAVGLVYPVGTFIAGIIGTGLALWRKYKPALVQAQKKQELAYNATTSLVGLIEDLKEISPDTWEKLKEKLKIGPEVENVIRAIRGLPPLV